MKFRSFNEELLISTALLVNVFNDIIIDRRTHGLRRDYTKPISLDEIIKQKIEIPCIVGERSNILRSLENEQGKYKLPLIILQNKAIKTDPIRMVDLYADVFYQPDNQFAELNPEDPLYKPQQLGKRRGQPIIMDFEMTIITKYKEDMDQILSNWIVHFRPDVYVKWWHPRIKTLPLTSQIIWNHNIGFDSPVEYNQTNVFTYKSTTNFSFKTWLFPGTNFVELEPPNEPIIKHIKFFPNKSEAWDEEDIERGYKDTNDEDTNWLFGDIEPDDENLEQQTEQHGEHWEVDENHEIIPNDDSSNNHQSNENQDENENENDNDWSSDEQNNNEQNQGDDEQNQGDDEPENPHYEYEVINDDSEFNNNNDENEEENNNSQNQHENNSEEPQNNEQENNNSQNQHENNSEEPQNNEEVNEEEEETEMKPKEFQDKDEGQLGFWGVRSDQEFYNDGSDEEGLKSGKYMVNNVFARNYAAISGDPILSKIHINSLYGDIFKRSDRMAIINQQWSKYQGYLYNDTIDNSGNAFLTNVYYKGGFPDTYLLMDPPSGDYLFNKFANSYVKNKGTEDEKIIKAEFGSSLKYKSPMNLNYNILSKNLTLSSEFHNNRINMKAVSVYNSKKRY